MPTPNYGGLLSLIYYGLKTPGQVIRLNNIHSKTLESVALRLGKEAPACRQLLEAKGDAECMAVKEVGLHMVMRMP